MTAFEHCVELVLSLEGEWSDHPDDAGTRTRWGISHRAYPSLDLSLLTKADAVELYRRDYWGKIRGDQLPTAVALVLFDWAVHAGPQTAVLRLQRLMGEVEDGKMGPRTLAAVRRWGQYTLTLALLRTRARELAALGLKPGQGVFLAGWAARLATIALDCGAELGFKGEGV